MFDDQAGRPKRIVVGVDGSDSSISALHWACALAALADAGIEALIAWQWPVTLGTAVPVPAEFDPAGDARSMLDGIVRPLMAAYPSVIIGARSVEGHPTEVLVEASRHADLLIVGSRGHREIAGLVLGSVSQYCVTHAASSVLVHRHHTRSE